MTPRHGPLAPPSPPSSGRPQLTVVQAGGQEVDEWLGGWTPRLPDRPNGRPWDVPWARDGCWDAGRWWRLGCTGIRTRIRIRIRIRIRAIEWLVGQYERPAARDHGNHDHHQIRTDWF